MSFLVPILLIGIAGAAMVPASARAAGPTLTIVVDDTTRSFDRDALLARPDAAEISVPRDIAYGAATIYRAVPLAGLLNVAVSADRVLEVQPEDGFVAQLPLEWVANRLLRTALPATPIAPP